jgi:hypothetical protein
MIHKALRPAVAGHPRHPDALSCRRRHQQSVRPGCSRCCRTDPSASPRVANLGKPAPCRFAHLALDRHMRRDQALRRL